MSDTKHTVLVVDDERVNLMVMMKLLAKLGDEYRVISAPNGLVACRLAEKKLPDIIIMDWEMPEMNGIEAAKALKKNPVTQDIPIILATAVRTSAENLSEALQAGAIDYLRKPIEEAELLARVKSALSLANSLKKVRDQHQQITEQSEELRLKNHKLTQALEELNSSHLQLAQSEKLATVGMLTAGIAHEINNPVNFIRNGMSSLSILVEDIFTLLDKYHSIDLTHVEEQVEGLDELENLKQHIEYTLIREDLPKIIESIQDGAHRTFEIARVLKSFSRKDGDAKEFMNIHDGIDGTLILLNHHLKGRIKVTKDYTMSLPALYCFPNQLNQVFMNLIHNAIQAIDDKGEIKISTSFDQTSIYIKVKDNGKGISPENQEKIFEPFFTTKDRNQGTGLGMSISHNIITKHQGNIQLESEEGVGTTFTLTLPIIKAETLS